MINANDNGKLNQLGNDRREENKKLVSKHYRSSIEKDR